MIIKINKKIISKMINNKISKNSRRKFLQNKK